MIAFGNFLQESKGTENGESCSSWPIKTRDGWDYKRVCIDGPVFDAGTLAWEAREH